MPKFFFLEILKIYVAAFHKLWGLLCELFWLLCSSDLSYIMVEGSEEILHFRHQQEELMIKNYIAAIFHYAWDKLHSVI